MKQSAIEKELLAYTLNLKYWLRSHDRGVIIAVLMGCIPILPITVIGFLLCLFNSHLLKKNKLELSEKRLIRVGLIIAMINIILGSLLILYIFNSASEVDWKNFLHPIDNLFSYFIEMIKENLNINHNNPSPINIINYVLNK